MVKNKMFQCQNEGVSVNNSVYLWLWQKEYLVIEMAKIIFLYAFGTSINLKGNY